MEEEEEWAGPPKDTRPRPCPSCVVMGWMVGVLAAVSALSLGLWASGTDSGAFSVLFFALIATVPLLGLRAILGRGHGVWFAALVGAGSGLVYGLLFHGLFEPIARAPSQQDSTVGLLFVAAGAIGGVVWWGLEWFLRE